MEDPDITVLVIVLIGGFSVLLIGTILWVVERLTRPLRQEREKAAQVAPRGVPVEGKVLAWASAGGGTEEAPAVHLRVQFPYAGSLHEAELLVSIDLRITVWFAPGSNIHLLVDPDDPRRVIVDTAASPIRLPDSL